MFPNGLTCCFKPPDANLGKLSSWNDFGKNKKIFLRTNDECGVLFKRQITFWPNICNNTSLKSYIIPHTNCNTIHHPNHISSNARRTDMCNVAAIIYKCLAASHDHHLLLQIQKIATKCQSVWNIFWIISKNCLFDAVFRYMDISASLSLH